MAVTSMVQNNNSMVSYFMNNIVAPPVYAHYTNGGGDVCTSLVSG
jgi:hypothetical protein